MGEAIPARTCGHCGSLKPLTASHWYANGFDRGGRRRWRSPCRDCYLAEANEAARKRRAAKQQTAEQVAAGLKDPIEAELFGS